MVCRYTYHVNLFLPYDLCLSLLIAGVKVRTWLPPLLLRAPVGRRLSHSLWIHCAFKIFKCMYMCSETSWAWLSNVILPLCSSSLNWFELPIKLDTRQFMLTACGSRANCFICFFFNTLLVDNIMSKPAPQMLTEAVSSDKGLEACLLTRWISNRNAKTCPFFYQSMLYLSHLNWAATEDIFPSPCQWWSSKGQLYIFAKIIHLIPSQNFRFGVNSFQRQFQNKIFEVMSARWFLRCLTSSARKQLEMIEPFCFRGVNMSQPFWVSIAEKM